MRTPPQTAERRAKQRPDLTGQRDKVIAAIYCSRGTIFITVNLPTAPSSRRQRPVTRVPATVRSAAGKRAKQ